MSFSIGPSGQHTEIRNRLAEILGPLDARGCSFSVASRGARWEPLQSLRPEGPPLMPSDFTVTAQHDFARDRMHISWQRNFLEPLTSTVHYDEIIEGKEGFITGADVALHPSLARPMTPDRLAAVERQQHLLHPHLLVAEAQRRQATTGDEVMRFISTEEIEGAPHAIIEIDAFPRPIFLVVNLDSNQITHLTTQENDYPRGDVDVVVTFSDWRLHDSMLMPHLVTLALDGVILHREERVKVVLAPEIADTLFDMPETIPFDPLLAARGLVDGQWMHRALAMGAPISLDPGEVEIVEISPEVISLGGGIHHSIAIALPTGIVVVDSPQDEERSLAVIDAIKAHWPDKPITHCILTHHHHDHSGGIRTYAAIGAELILAQGDRAFITDCLTRPHTIVPDLLEGMDIQPTIITVGDTHLSLGGGAIEVHRISSPHSAEDLVTYVAGPKLLFNADLFNPGLVPKGAAPPPHWLVYSRDFRKQIEALDLDVALLIGAHGALDGRPYQSLIDFTK